MRNRILVSILGLLTIFALLGVACTGAAPEPRIIEKEVIVVREVIKEVPVEVEVIREVLVVKEVVKEVPVKVETVPTMPITVKTLRDNEWGVYFAITDSPGNLGELHLFHSKDGMSRIVVYFNPISGTVESVGMILLACSAEEFTTVLLCHLDGLGEEYRNIELQNILDQLLSR